MRRPRGDFLLYDGCRRRCVGQATVADVERDAAITEWRDVTTPEGVIAASMPRLRAALLLVLGVGARPDEVTRDRAVRLLDRVVMEAARVEEPARFLALSPHPRNGPLALGILRGMIPTKAVRRSRERVRQIVAKAVRIWFAKRFPDIWRNYARLRRARVNWEPRPFPKLSPPPLPPPPPLEPATAPPVGPVVVGAIQWFPP